MRVWALLLFCAVLPAQEIVFERRLRADFDQPLQRMESPAPFHAVGLIADQSSHAHVRVRHSLDGQSWSDSYLVDAGHDGGALLWIEEGARFLELGSPADLRVLLIEPKRTPRTPRKPRGNSMELGVEQEIIPRAEWGCGPECAPRAAPVFANVTHLVVHHSAGANQASNWAAVVRSIWVLHVQGNGWNDIGYNYLIDPNGAVYEGRAGGDGVIGAHFSGVNTGTMGVCLMGTYGATPPTQPALDSLRRLLVWQSAKWKLDPSGQSLHRSSNLILNTISGHRDAGLSPNASGATECPGNALYTYLPDLRRRAANEYPACRIQPERRNYCIPGSGASLELRFANPKECPVGASIPVDWMRLEGGRLIVDANPGGRRSAEFRLADLVLHVAQAESGVSNMPCPSLGAVVNAASFDTRPLGRGALATIFGDELWREGSSLRILVNNNVPASVLAATPNQINFALPANVPTGSARLVVERDGIRSPETMFWVSEAAPAIFLAQNHSNSLVNSESQPVRSGEALIVYVTGIGTNTNLPWSLEWDGATVPALYLGPTPGFLGLSQANLIVPVNSSLGTHRLRVIVSGVPSQEIAVFVAN